MDSPWRLFITMPTKLLLHSHERAILLLSSLFKINPSDCELQIKETGVSADQLFKINACDNLKI